jgi:hypothetical protein
MRYGIYVKKKSFVIMPADETDECGNVGNSRAAEGRGAAGADYVPVVRVAQRD